MGKDLKNKQVILSLIMPVYNGEKYLQETLECISRQTFKNFELIILDNQSNDNSQKIIKFFQKNDNRVRYILDTKKRNGNDCWYELIKYSNGKYLIPLNDDNYFTDNYFEILVNKIQKKNLDMVITNGCYVDENKKYKGKFYKKKMHYFGKPNMLRVIRFFLKGDVMPLILPSIYLLKSYEKLLPFINLSLFENDADTLFGVQILSNFEIDTHNEQLFFCRVYLKHERFHDNNLPNSFFNVFKEKVKHDINLIKYLIKEIFKSKLSIVSKFILMILFPLLMIVKRFKNNVLKYISMFKKYI